MMRSNPEGSRELLWTCWSKWKISKPSEHPGISTQWAGNQELQGCLPPCHGGIKLQHDFIAKWLGEQKICYSEQGGQGEAASRHVRSQQHALHGAKKLNKKKFPNTQISISCRFVFPSAPEVTGQANSLQILEERFALSLVTPCKPSATSALCHFCLKAAPAPQHPTLSHLCPSSSPGSVLLLQHPHGTSPAARFWAGFGAGEDAGTVWQPSPEPAQYCFQHPAPEPVLSHSTK